MKRFTQFLTMIGLFISGAGFCQSWDIIQREPGVMITDVCFLSDGMNGFAVGSSSGAGGNLTGQPLMSDQEYI
jgi:hypothetical protein